MVQVQGDVLALHGIAAKLRAKRFGSGALRLDNTKLNFSLDADGNPEDAHPHGEHALSEEVLIAGSCATSASVWAMQLCLYT